MLTDNILELIGNTPLLQLKGENIVAKAEFLNPGGSIKDRVALAMLEAAERDGKRCYEMRYYILSRKLSSKEFAAAVRSHWSIENNLHWQLDVTFGEDQSRVRKGHADTNLSILRRTALSLLKNNKTVKVGVKNKRLNAAWDDDYLQQVLLGQ